MKKLLIVTVLAAGLAIALLGLVFLTRSPGLGSAPTTPAPPEAIHPATDPPSHTPSSFLFGRVTTDEGDVYEGRLRFGTSEEAFWDDTFNGYKAENSWAEFVPPEKLTERVPIKIFGFEIASRTRQIDLDRPFMVRFGDVSRIEVDGRDLRATLKSGTVFGLDRFNADDIADGVRVWDADGGVVDLVEWQIRSIEFLPTPRWNRYRAGFTARFTPQTRNSRASSNGTARPASDRTCSPARRTPARSASASTPSDPSLAPLPTAPS